MSTDPSTVKISLAPPRPLSNVVFPLAEDHVRGLDKSSEGGTKLPNTIEKLAKEHNIHPNLVIRHRDQLEELVTVYGTAKTHTVAYKGGVNDLLKEFGDEIISLSQDIELLFPKLHNYVDYHDSKSVVNGIIEILTFSLSNLILKAGQIVDTAGEAGGSVQYGDVHVDRVHKQAGGLLRTTAFHKDLKNIGGALPNTVTTMLTLQGGLAHMLVNLSAVKSRVGSGVLDPGQIYANQPTAEVVSAWAELKKKAYEYRDSL